MGVFISVACIFLDFDCVVGQTRLNWYLFRFDGKNFNCGHIHTNERKSKNYDLLLLLNKNENKKIFRMNVVCHLKRPTQLRINAFVMNIYLERLSYRFTACYCIVKLISCKFPFFFGFFN